MSKIICDVCGTSYPETATQCPICGSVRPGEVITVTDGEEQQPARTYTPVKGGRFSKANVKKRNKGKQVSGAETVDDEYTDYDEQKGNRGLIIAIIALLLAIIAVVIYIAVRFFGPGGAVLPENTSPDTQNSASTTEATDDTTEATDAVILCEDIVISKKKIEFEKKGAALLLNVTVMPKDTTEEIIFASSDESVATVTQGGKITSIGGGEAVITVTCGSVVTQCEVLCTFESGNEETTEPTTEPVSAEDFKLNREDFTMSSKGETHKLYNGDIPDDQIKWTSGDEKVVKVDKGVVKAVGKGYTTVYAEYNGIKLSCIVRCADSVGAYEEQTEEETDNDSPSTPYKISDSDVTIAVGEAFTLTLTDEANNVLNVSWTSSDPAVCTVSGNSITGSAAGVSVVTTEYEGVTYTCIVRVKG